MTDDYPGPPAHERVTPLIITLSAGDVLYRFNPAGKKSGLFFGKTGDYRWDAPNHSYGVLYASRDVDTAFAETYGHGVTKHSLDTNKVISHDSLKKRDIYEFTVQQELQLAMFYGEGLSVLSLDANICTMPDYSVPQQWSGWVHNLRNKPDGIIYLPRHLTTGASVALFERAAAGLAEKSLGVADKYRDPDTGRTIDDILESQGWALHE
ncbi:MAG: RES family NAD+ phosphorylase [Pseudomonadota bacterium]